MAKKKNKSKSIFTTKLYMTLLVVVIFFIGLSIYFYFNVEQSKVYRSAVTISNPNKLIVTRAEDKPDNLSSLKLTITNASLVKELYDDIYLLPTFVPGVNYKCPEDDTKVVYNLNFYQDNKIINQAIYRPGGCASVTLDNSTPRIVEDSFQSDFQQVTGLSGQSLYGYQQ